MTDNNYKFLTGLHIESIGNTTSKPGGCIFYFGNHAAPTGTYSINTFPNVEFEWIQCVNKLPQKLKRTVDPFTNDYRAIPHTWEFENSDLVAGLFQRIVTSPSLNILEDVTATSTDIVADSGYNNHVMWVGDEAILLSGWDGTSYTGSTRGYYSSPKQPHSAGDNLYSYNPFWSNRVATVVRYNVDEDELEIIARGFVKSMPDSKSPETISITINDWFNTWLNTDLNKDAVDWSRSPQLRQSPQGFVAGRNLRIDGKPLESGVAPPEQAQDQPVGVQIGDAVVRGVIDDEGKASVSTENQLAGNLGTSPVRFGELDLEELDDGASEYPDNAWELLVVDIKDEGRYQNAKISSTFDLAKPYHPLAFILSLLKSNGDKGSQALFYRPFGSSWGLDAQYLKQNEIVDLINATPNLDSSLRQIVWGWDGKAVRFGSRVRELMRGYGLFWATADSQLSVDQLQVLDLDQASEAFDNSVVPFWNTFGWEGPRAQKQGTLTAIVGELPFKEGTKVTVNRKGDSRRAKLLQSNDFDYTFEGIEAVNAVDLVPVLTNLAEVTAFSLPRIRIHVPAAHHSGVDYDLGTWISLDDVPDGLLVDKAGNRIANLDSTDESFIGMIVGIEHDLESYAPTLDILLMNFRAGVFARQRAASMVLTSVSSGKYYTYSDSQFGNENDDASYFTVGDEVQTWNMDGSRANGSDFHTVTAVGVDGDGPYIELSGVFSSVTFGNSMVIRLAQSDEYSNNTRYSFTDRPYVYPSLAGVIYVSGGTEESDIYGGTFGWGG